MNYKLICDVTRKGKLSQRRPGKCTTKVNDEFCFHFRYEVKTAAI